MGQANCDLLTHFKSSLMLRGGGERINEMQRGGSGGVRVNEMRRGVEGVGNNEMQRGGEGGCDNQLERQPQQMIGEFTFDKWNVKWTGGEGAGGGGNPLN